MRSYPVGCTACRDTGYYGRTGVYELIAIDEKLSEYIHDNASEAVMETYARKTHCSMRKDGWRRVLNGDTTLEEVLRVTTED